MPEVPAELTLDELNQLPAPTASKALSTICAAERWVGAVLAGRPYRSVHALLARSDAAVGSMAEADLRAALAGHPRIGDRRTPLTGWSSQEQAGVAVDDAELMRALAVGNSAYEQRYGHIYLVCANGRTGHELLELLLDRLRNDRATEWRVVAEELAKINQLRLRKLVLGVADSVPTPPAHAGGSGGSSPWVGTAGSAGSSLWVGTAAPRPSQAEERKAQPAVVSGLSTHVLDTVKGQPAKGIVVRVERDGRELGRGATDADGRIADFGIGQLGAGVYRLVFETEAYLGLGNGGFFPEVVVTFRADGLRPKYHIPLVLSGFSYSTYRGS